MTFYEAALRVLEGESRPLHFLEITEKSLAQNLLSHVGKTPELTMLSRLAAMARRTRDKRIVVTARDTFALTEWGLPEDPEALAQTGVAEPHPEESMPPLRTTERHPEPRLEHVRVAGRGSERKQRRREDEEAESKAAGSAGRRRRYPPVAEVVFEILSDTEGALRPAQLLERAREKELVGEEVTVEAILHALLEDNQRRIDAGRRPQFSFQGGEVSLERAGAPSEAPPLELQAAFAAALGIPLEGGRPVLPRQAAAAAAAEASPEVALVTAARTAVKEARKAAARALRKRLGELDVGTFEKSVVKVMHALGWRELKVAKRSKEGPLLTARKREGSVELRYAVRLLRGAPAVERKAVLELRKDLGHYSAQVGLLVSAGEVRGDARTEAQATGALVLLWCGDALGEKFLEARAAVSVTTVELYELDERFFEVAKLDAQEAQKRREERQRERQARAEASEPEEVVEEPRRAGEEAEPAQGAAAEPQRQEALAPAELPPAEGEEEGEDEEGDEDLEAASAFVAGAGPQNGEAAQAGAERKRRRRRRRGRRGRGGRPNEQGAGGGAEGEGGAAPAGGQAAEAAAGGGEGGEPRPAESSALPAAAAGGGPGEES